MLVRCCAAGKNGCLDLRCRAFALDGRVSGEWSRYPGSMARRDRDRVAPMRRSSAQQFGCCEGWNVVRWCRTQASSHNSQGVVTKQEHSTLRLSAPGLGWLFVELLLQHPSRASKPPQDATRDVNFLRSDSRCRQYVSDLSNVTPRYLGLEQKGRVSLLKLALSSCLASLLLRWKAANTVL